MKKSTSRKKRKSNGDFSKFMVTVIIICVLVFVALCFITFWIMGSTPDVLIERFFNIFVLELFALAAIKISGNVKDTIRHKYDARYGNSEDDDYLGG